MTVVNNTAFNRFELEKNGELAVLEYSIPKEDVLLLSHTEVPESMSGQGVGSALAKQSLEMIKSAGWKMIPVCPFIISYIKRHPEYQELVYTLPEN